MSSLEEPGLAQAFGQPEPAHYAWQTQHSVVSVHERELVRSAFLPLGQRVLDVGCAEGATPFHLTEGAGATRFTGVDLFEPKLAFARSRISQHTCTFVRASAYALPFPDHSFDHVLVRDALHHMNEPERALSEMARVLTPGGRIDVLEPCRYNPLIVAHALSQKVERGELRSSEPFLRGLLQRSGFEDVRTTRHQPLPLHRLAFHPRWGLTSLSRSKAYCNTVRALESVAAKLLPGPLWAYLHLRALRPA